MQLEAVLLVFIRFLQSLDTEVSRHLQAELYFLLGMAHFQTRPNGDNSSCLQIWRPKSSQKLKADFTAVDCEQGSSKDHFN